MARVAVKNYGTEKLDLCDHIELTEVSTEELEQSAQVEEVSVFCRLCNETHVIELHV